MPNQELIIYEGAMCCATGVMRAEPDRELMEFNETLKRLTSEYNGNCKALWGNANAPRTFPVQGYRISPFGLQGGKQFGRFRCAEGAAAAARGAGTTPARSPAGARPPRRLRRRGGGERRYSGRRGGGGTSPTRRGASSGCTPSPRRRPRRRRRAGRAPRGSRRRGGAGARRSRRRGDRRDRRPRRRRRRGRWRTPAGGRLPVGPVLVVGVKVGQEHTSRGIASPPDSVQYVEVQGGCRAIPPERTAAAVVPRRTNRKTSVGGRSLPKFLLAPSGTRRDILSARSTSGPNRLARHLLQCRQEAGP